MERQRLIAARKGKHWTQEEVAEKLGIDANTYYRWEAGTQTPRDHSRRSLCNIFDMTAEALGLDGGNGSIAIVAPPMAKEPPSFLHADLTMRLMSLAFTVYTGFQDLQDRLMMVLEEFDAMTGKEAEITRRGALQRLATLPFVTLALGEGQSITSPRSTAEVLRHCAAALTACWELSRSREHEDLTLAFKAASTYFALVAPIVKDSAQYRQEAAELAAQCALLKTLLGWHLEGPQAALPYAQEAQVYAKEAKDIPLLLSVIDYSSWLYHYAHQTAQALKVSEQAMPLLRKYGDAMPSRLIGGMYATLAVMQAKNGNAEGIATVKRATTAFFTPTPGDDHRFVYMDYTPSEIVLADGMVQYSRRNYKKSLDSLGQLIDFNTLDLKMPLPERSHIETINLIALAELKSKDRDKEHVTRCWTTAIEGAKHLQSEQRFSESLVAYEIMEGVWPGDVHIEDLRDYIVHW